MDTQNKQLLQPLVLYLAVSLFIFAFGQIYEYFGFGVKSGFMHFAFLIPLMLGFVPRLILFFLQKTPAFPEIGLALWRLGIATLVIGSLFHGALDIYGTTSALTTAYPVAGLLCLFMAFICLCVNLKKKA